MHRLLRRASRADRLLEERERGFRALAENTPDSIVRWDRELRRIYVNPAFANVAGVPAAELIGRPFGTVPEELARTPSMPRLRRR